MPTSFFVVPLVLSSGIRIARYTEDEWGGAFGLPDRSSQVRYSRDSNCILKLDAPQTYLDEVQVQSDTRLICARTDLDTAIGESAAATVQTFLENRGIPSQWVQGTDSHREILRGLIGIFFFTQRTEGIRGISIQQSMLNAGVTLDDTWADIGEVAKEQFLEVMRSVRFNIHPPDNATFRQIFREIAIRVLAVNDATITNYLDN